MNRRSLRHVNRLWLVAAIGLIVGCSGTASNDGPVDSVQATTMDETPPAQSAPAEIDLDVVDRAKYDEVIAGLGGKVVLVDFWATWCGPCVQQFPHTVELAERLADQGLAVATVSFDDPNDLEPIRRFLQERDAGQIMNLVNQYGLGPQAMEAFEIVGGALPSYKLYDRSGRLRKTFESDPLAKRQFTPQDIEGAVEELLAE